MSEPISLLTLPRELRDEIFGFLSLPPFVYTSTSKPNTANLHRSKIDADTFIDTRIYLPCRAPPNFMGVCRQLRFECLQQHTYNLNTSTPPSSPIPKDPDATPNSSILASRLGNERDEEAERLNDTHSIRITLEAQRAQRGKFGYFTPVRDTLSPRFLALLPLLSGAKSLRLVIWPGFDWWNGSRPRAMKIENGRARVDETGKAENPDAVSYAIGKVLEMLPGVEEVRIEILVHVGALSQWDLPSPPWTNIQYWLDSPISPQLSHTQNIKSVTRSLAVVWDPVKIEGFYEQDETKLENGRWNVKRHGDVKTVSGRCGEGVGWCELIVDSRQYLRLRTRGSWMKSMRSWTRSFNEQCEWEREGW